MSTEEKKQLVDVKTVDTVVGAVSEYTTAVKTIAPGVKTDAPMQDLLVPGRAEVLSALAARLNSSRGARNSG